MIRVMVVAVFPADALGPAATYVEDFFLPPWFAKDALAAHAELMRLILSEGYLELPQHEGTGLIPLNSETVRMLLVREV